MRKISLFFLACHEAEVKTSYSFVYLTPDNEPRGISHQTFVKKNQVRWKLWICGGLAHLPLSYGNHTCTQQSTWHNKTYCWWFFFSFLEIDIL